MEKITIKQLMHRLIRPPSQLEQHRTSQILLLEDVVTDNLLGINKKEYQVHLPVQYTHFRSNGDFQVLRVPYKEVQLITIYDEDFFKGIRRADFDGSIKWMEELDREFRYMSADEKPSYIYTCRRYDEESITEIVENHIQNCLDKYQLCKKIPESIDHDARKYIDSTFHQVLG